MRLIIDCRMHASSGIGTVIKNIVPFLIREFDCQLIFNHEAVCPFEGKYEIILFSAKIYSVYEQWEFFLKIREADAVWSPHYNYPLLLRGKIRRVVTVHDVYHLDHIHSLPLLQRWYAKLFLVWNIQKVDILTTVSEFSRGRIYHYCKLPVEKVQVIYHGINSGIFYPSATHSLKLPGNYLLFVGNIKPHKNLKTFLKAYILLNSSFKEKYQIIFVGKKEGFIGKEKELDDFIREYELEKYIHFTGYVQDADLAEIYSRAALFIFPSRYEGFGLPPLEAMSCDTPVICSNAASLPEVCGDAVVYFDPANPVELAEKIRLLINDKEKTGMLIKAGKERVRQFTWEKSGKAYVNVFKQAT